GSRSPRLGLFIAAIDPTAFDPGYEERAETHLLRLHERFGIDVGRRRPPRTHGEIPEDLYQALAATTDHEREATARAAPGSSIPPTPTSRGCPCGWSPGARPPSPARPWTSAATGSSTMLTSCAPC